jgi:hypothetical protein
MPRLFFEREAFMHAAFPVISFVISGLLVRCGNLTLKIGTYRPDRKLPPCMKARMTMDTFPRLSMAGPRLTTIFNT